MTTPQEPADAVNAFRRLMTLVQFLPRAVQEDTKVAKDLDALERFLAALDAAPGSDPNRPPSVPDGWKLVPREPTREMTDVVYRTGVALGLGQFIQPGSTATWTAMWDAAPLAPLGGGETLIAALQEAYAKRSYKSEVTEGGRHSIRVDFAADHEAAHAFADTLAALDRRAPTCSVASASRSEGEGAVTPLDRAWAAVNGLGGSDDASEYNKAIDDVLKALEGLGATDAAWRASA